MPDRRTSQRFHAAKRSEGTLRITHDVFVLEYVLIMPAIRTKLAAAFAAWGGQINGLWTPNPPG